MNILERALDRIRGEPADRPERVVQKKGKSGSDVCPSKNRSSAIDSIVDQDIEIDIRLDEDLSDYDQKQARSHFKEEEVDFNLTSPENLTEAFVESQVLSINPTRSFSRHVDLDLNRLGAAGYITPDKINTLLSSTFRQLKRPILNNVIGKGASVVDNANLVMFTSSVAGEGKTFSSINMAMSIAMERDKRVLLVDADVNHPSHDKIFGIQMQNGLTDVLSGKVSDVSEVIHKTNIPSLSLMLAGNPTPHAPELFASRAMEDFVRDLSSRYEDRIIIFDSAPLLLLTEASVLASHVGQVVLVVEAEKTRKELVQQSLGMLSNRIELVLLNKMREQNDLGGYGLYGSYQD